MNLLHFISFVRQNAPSFMKVVYHAFKGYKRSIVWLVLLGFLGSFVEAIGISAVIPLFSFLTGASSGDDLISRTVEAVFQYAHIPFTFRYILLFVVLLFLLRAIMLLVTNFMRISITADYEEKTRTDLFNRTLKGSWPYLLKQKLGTLETLLMLNVAHGERFLNSFSSAIIAVTGLLMYTLVAFTISFNIALFTLLLGGLLLFLFRPLVSMAHLWAKDMESANREMAHHVNENIFGMKTVKSAQVDREVLAIGKHLFHSLRELKVKISLLRLLPVSLMQPLGVIFVVFIFAFSYKSPNFNLAALVATVYLIQRIFLYVEQFQSHLQIFGESLPFLKEVVAYAEEARVYQEVSVGTVPFTFEQKIAFKNVSFSYEGREAVLEGLTFDIPRGSMVGLIGPSGAGKTTIVDLLLRMFTPTKGQILIDNVPIDTVSMREWRKNIGYVPQDSFLMNDSIANNIRFYDSSISDDEVLRAAEMVDLKEFVLTLPMGFDTKVGERGIMLSGGQRQRIVIARSLARQPAILLFDEATSALDKDSEAEIQTVLERLRGMLTVMIIAHRLSTIMNADKVIVLENGKVLEEGAPQELLKNSSSYFGRQVSNKSS